MPPPTDRFPGTVVMSHEPAPSGTTLEAVPTSPRLPSPIAVPVATAFATGGMPTADPAIPLPTAHPGNEVWVRHRLDAVISLYSPTPAGRALLHSLDMRGMPGEPGYFGSYGFYSWAGIGEAKPIPIMHELGHSYWGAFPVIGRPELSWQAGPGEEIAPAMSAYHQDILAFMAQPPDDYELLRQRLRNLPGLSVTNTEPLFHSLEADVPYTTGGDLLLVPPILRRYWGHFLTAGPFGTWEQAAGWLQSLSHDERAIAGGFLGLEHLDLRQYAGLPAFSTPSGFLSTAEEVLAAEERQRLTDLAEQFDLLVGDSRLEENFDFWRGYLRDKLALQRSHPEFLELLPIHGATELSDALTFLAELEGSPEETATALAQRMAVQPLLVNFLPAVDDRVLVSLFASNPDLPEAPTLQATASFVERLQRFGSAVESVLGEGRRSPALGAAALETFLDDTGVQQEQDLKLFFDLFHNADPITSRAVMTEMEQATVQALMSPVPEQLRGIFDPDGLLGKLGITVSSSTEDFSQGLELLVDEASGNYRIDEPFLERLFQVVAERAESDPAEVGVIMGGTPFPLEGFIISHAAAARLVFSHDLGVARRLVRASDSVVAPPARIVYRLIHADPALAATLVAGLDESGDHELVLESLAYFAYDKARSDKFPQLPISLEQDGAFLWYLMESRGAGWLEERLQRAVDMYRRKAEMGEVDTGFVERFRETLLAAVEAAPSGSVGLGTVVNQVFD